MGEFIDGVFLCSRYDGNLRVASNPRMVYLGAMASEVDVVVVICGMK
jgi:hypothetical protein